MADEVAPFGRILVPLDHAEKNTAAVERAAKLALAFDGHVHLLHVIEPIAGLEPGEEEEFFRRLEEKARDMLEGHGQRLEVAGARWGSEIVYGPRARSWSWPRIRSR